MLAKPTTEAQGWLAALSGFMLAKPTTEAQAWLAALSGFMQAKPTTEAQACLAALIQQSLFLGSHSALYTYQHDSICMSSICCC